MPFARVQGKDCSFTGGGITRMGGFLQRSDRYLLTFGYAELLVQHPLVRPLDMDRSGACTMLRHGTTIPQVAGAFRLGLIAQTRQTIEPPPCCMTSQLPFQKYTFQGSSFFHSV